jgi:hypothetical protein
MIICEPISEESQHLPFNQAVLQEIINNEASRIIFYAAESHWLKFAPRIKTSKHIEFINIDPIGRADNASAWIKAFVLLCSIKKKVRSKEKIIFLSSTSGTIGLSELLFSKNRVYNILHMALARMDRHVPRNPFTKWLSIRKTISRIVKPNIYIVMLEENITENLLRVFPYLKHNVISLPHPLPLDAAPVIKKVVDKKFINICFPGTFSTAKGASLFENLTESFSKSERLKFVIAGKKDKSWPSYKEKLFDISPSCDYLSRAEYLRKLRDSTYLFLGHDEAIYKWCASGVYLDALCQGIPIIAKRSVFFENEFSIYGEFGYLFNTLEDIQVFLKQENLNVISEIHTTNIAKAKVSREIQFEKSLDVILNDQK